MQKNQRRVVIENVYPELNNGNFYIKRIVNEIVTVSADVLSDGHDVIAATVLYKHENSKVWKETRMDALDNNNWKASFTVEKQGFYSYKVVGWIDYALNWQHGISRKIEDNQNVTSELLEGVDFLKKCIKKATTSEKIYLQNLVNRSEERR